MNALAKQMADFEIFLIEKKLCVSRVSRKDGQWRVILGYDGKHGTACVSRGNTIPEAFSNAMENFKRSASD